MMNRTERCGNQDKPAQQDRLVKTRQPEQDVQDRTDRTGQSGQNSQNRIP
jgi:hypothetical protein